MIKNAAQPYLQKKNANIEFQRVMKYKGETGFSNVYKILGRFVSFSENERNSCWFQVNDLYISL